MKSIAPALLLYGAFALAANLNAFESSLLWQRSFEPVTYGDQSGPNPDHRFAGGRGAQNLAFYQDKLALVGTDLPQPEERYYLSILDANTGETVSSAKIRSDVGNSRSYLFPWAIVSASGENVPGLLNIQWDPASGILFTAQGAYDSAYTAYLPLGGISDGMASPAYGYLEDKPGLADAWGRTAAEHWTLLGTGQNPIKGKAPDIWGLSAAYMGESYDPEEGKRPKYDLDWEDIWNRQGASYYNVSGRFALQPGGSLVGLSKGAGWGHNQAGHFYLFNRYTGMKALAEKPEMPKNQQGIELRPFTADGLAFSEDRLYLIGPGEDRNSDGQLGAKRPEGVIPKVDQGLAIWAYDLELLDLQPNDGVGGPATLDTAKLSLAFSHSLPSPYTEDDSLESYGQSWYETDGFYRPKPMLTDAEGVWVSWKPSMAGNVQLIHASAEGLTRIDLGVGSGMKGVDLWPKLKQADSSDGPRLVYATGNSLWRERVRPADIDAFMADFPVNRTGTILFEDATEQDQEKARSRVRDGGAWSPELSPPRGDAGLAVVDPQSKELLWSENLSERFPEMRPNGFWTFIDRSHLTVAGDEALFGFVDTTGTEATLVLARYNLTVATTPEPQVERVPLGFPAGDYPGSALTDLQFVDGKLYALVTQGKVFTLRDPRWQAQHVLAFE